jgi:hypothetical protein
MQLGLGFPQEEVERETVISTPRRGDAEKTRRSTLAILQGGFSAVDAMCDRPPSLSPADARGVGTAKFPDL